ncbi:ribosome maturation factor RimP, partial [Campylobacter lanienae]
VSLDDCEIVSKLLSPIYDVMPPVSGDWVLEVSSPGLERKLSKIDHFAKSIGEMAKVALNDKSQIVGKITSVNGDDILINSDEGNININFNDIKKAKTFIQW